MLKKSFAFPATLLCSLVMVLLPFSYGFAGGAGDHHHDEAAGHHAHDKWVAPPKGYARKHTNDWGDVRRAERGKQLYATNCVSCHGVDGRGSGPLAAGLAHAPADLTNHFHYGPGQGDGYLFWRISEGGVVEPFKSAQSAMPPFKTSLTEQQRWDVLIYVHQAFHQGFKTMQHESGHADMHESPKETGHPHAGHEH